MIKTSILPTKTTFRQTCHWGVCSTDNAEKNIVVDNNSIIIFDGRLLNKQELCSGINIKSDSVSDAGLVLKLFRKQGAQCLKILKGYWALIYFDAANKCLYSARV
jgi:asparagine synthetase B (glutamine-hydrolysing)